MKQGPIFSGGVEVLTTNLTKPQPCFVTRLGTWVAQVAGLHMDAVRK